MHQTKPPAARISADATHATPRRRVSSATMMRQSAATDEVGSTQQPGTSPATSLLPSQEQNDRAADRASGGVMMINKVLNAVLLASVASIAIPAYAQTTTASGYA